MVLIKLKSGNQQSIAWVDEKEKCFFPAFIVEGGGGLLSDKSDGNLEDSISCFVCGVDKVAYGEAFASQHEMIKEVIVESESPPPQRWLPAVDSLWPELVRLDRDGNAFHSVMRGFLSGMGTFADPSSVVEIFRVNPKASTSMDRREMFVQQQIHTTTVRHSHANVRSAWYGASKENLSKILIHGFHEGARLCKGAAYGTGIYLAPGNRSFSCASHCDVDEKGLQYMLLCRVIMGNVEQVTKGSRQYLPSKPEFDCGVGDLVRPKRYVVWGTHSNTNIHPDYVVCFKLSLDCRDYFSGLMDIESSKIVLTQNEQISSTTNPVVGGLQAPSRPTTPWVGFTTLFSEIRDSIPPVARELLSLHLEEYTCRMISRKEFVLKLRLIVGNKLLLSAFERCKQNPSFYRAYKEELV